MRAANWLLFCGLLVTSFADGADSVQDLQARYQQAFNTPQGQQSILAFWAEADFIRSCAPPDGQIVKPLTIYVVMQTDGTVAHFAVEPRTETARCVEQRIKTHIFSRPPIEFVARIDLNLTPTTGDFVDIMVNPFTTPVIKGARDLRCDWVWQSSTTTDTPTTNPDRKEISRYKGYLCSMATPKYFVLWRTREHAEHIQLAGELIVPASILRSEIRVDASARSWSVFLDMGGCKVRGGKPPDDWAYALLSTADVKQRTPKERVLFAWRVDFVAQRLIAIPTRNTYDCLE